jgi:spore germination cell wall hydrolase CwlJ-like protein
LGFKLIACYRTRALIAASSVGILIGASFGAAFLGARLAQDSVARNQAIRLMQLSAVGLADAPSTEALAVSSSDTSQSALSDYDQSVINDTAMNLAVRYSPDETNGRLNTSLAQNIAYTRISGDQRSMRQDRSRMGAQVIRASMNLTPSEPTRTFASPMSAPPMVFSQKSQSDADCLSQAVYYEARGEGLDGMRAVAQVILNRVRHPSYPKTICGVVYQGARLRTGCQFSFTCNGTMARGPAGWAWQRSRQVAENALNGFVFRPVGTATHFHTGQVNPIWAKRMAAVATIGAHTFYQFRGRGAHINNGLDTVIPSDTPGLSGTEVQQIALGETPEITSQPDNMPDVAEILSNMPAETVNPVTIKATIDEDRASDITAKINP